jgi:hypothetical protein
MVMDKVKRRAIGPDVTAGGMYDSQMGRSKCTPLNITAGNKHHWLHERW